MIINSPRSPYLIHTDLLTIRWYGVLIALAILISYFFILKAIKQNKISENKFDSVFLITVVSGIIGARLAFILQNTSYYFAHPKEMFFIFDGGLSIHGAIILGVIALILSCRKIKLDPLKVGNIMAPYLLLSGAIGRWGNFFNQEIVGKPTEGFFKLYISPQNRPIGFESHAYFLPVFAFESLLLFSFFVIFFATKRFRDYALVYTLITYSIARIIVEFFRIDYKPIFIGLDFAQIVSFAIIIVACIVALTYKKK